MIFYTTCVLITTVISVFRRRNTLFNRLCTKEICR